MTAGESRPPNLPAEGVLVFAYGSLVSRESAAGTVGRRLDRDAGPLPATLHGYRRAWNVGSGRESHPERELVDAGGREFTGTLAVLGITPDQDAWCNGAVYRFEAADLKALTIRERNYVVVEVTDLLRRAPSPSPSTAARGRVVTFVPREDAVDRLVRARREGTAAVRRAYARQVETAFGELGRGHLGTFRTTTEPHGLPERDIRARPRRAGFGIGPAIR